MTDPINNDSESLLPDLSDPADLDAEIDRVRKDKEFMAIVKKIVEQDREILDRLAE
jgi:hypothetical protein